MCVSLFFASNHDVAFRVLNARRYNERGRAVLEKQLERLRSSSGPEFFFVSYSLDAKESQSAKADAAGALLNEPPLVSSRQVAVSKTRSSSI